MGCRVKPGNDESGWDSLVPVNPPFTGSLQASGFATRAMKGGTNYLFCELAHCFVEALLGRTL
jgi:hypothetical protein